MYDFMLNTDELYLDQKNDEAETWSQLLFSAIFNEGI